MKELMISFMKCTRTHSFLAILFLTFIDINVNTIKAPLNVYFSYVSTNVTIAHNKQVFHLLGFE